MDDRLFNTCLGIIMVCGAILCIAMTIAMCNETYHSVTKTIIAAEAE